MKRMIVAAGLVLIPCVAFGQEEPIMSPRERMEADLSHLRGRYEAYEERPGIRRAEPWPQSFFGTTTPSPRPRTTSETVSVASLSHRVPKAAKKAFDRGMKFIEKREVRRAMEDLEKAVALDPEYADAHANLGVVYVSLGRLQEGEAETRRAIALDPDVSITHSNLGWLLFKQRNLREAERSARRALALSLNNEKAHGLLGIVLAATPATRAEGVRHLEQSVLTLPEVQYLLGTLREP